MSDNNPKNPKELNELYDGIVEHDHPLPNWWVATFVLTVVFSIFYYAYYELGSGPSTDQELEQKLAQIEVLKKESVGKAFDNLDALVQEEKFVNRGQVIYAEKCFMCHGDKGQGLIGPNLTDNFWIHGNSPAEILKVIQKGVPEKGMVPWENVLSPEDQIATVAYVRSLMGKNVPGKAAEGVEVK